MVGDISQIGRVQPQVQRVENSASARDGKVGLEVGPGRGFERRLNVADANRSLGSEQRSDRADV